MAQRRCPCCGAPYNGKRCRQCYYEPFTEEIAHGNHTHEGEPLVIQSPPAAKPPRPNLEQSGDCKRFVGRKKMPAIFGVLIVVFVLIAVSIISKVFFLAVNDMEVVIRDETIAIDEDRLMQGLTLYDENGIRVVADWQPGRFFDNEMQIWLVNDSPWEVDAYSDQIYVNGYLLERASFYCTARPGNADTSYLWIDEDELEALQIHEIQQLRLQVTIMDDDTYETVGTGELVEITFPASEDYEQTIDDHGQVLWDQDGIRVIFRGIVGSNDCQDAKLELFLENNSDVLTEINFGNTLVNGEEVPIYCFCTLQPGTRAVTTAALWLLPNENITQVAQIRSLEVSLELIGEGDWQNAVITDPIQLNLN